MMRVIRGSDIRNGDVLVSPLGRLDSLKLVRAVGSQVTVFNWAWGVEVIRPQTLQLRLDSGWKLLRNGVEIDRSTSARSMKPESNARPPPEGLERAGEK